jgi:oxygen-independent coproporphyrinogen-3 oxidase
MSAGAASRRITPATVPGELMERYATSGPRYTSYPTAPQFRTEFDAARIEEEWRRTNERGTGLSLYVHIPFCKERCRYCGCFTETGHDADTAETYVGALLREADRLLGILDGHRPLEQLALGGGTPVFLTPEQMRRLIEGLRARFSFAPDGERSLEIDPRRVDSGYLDLLIELGFNRFSFGVQDLDPRVQRNVGRILPVERLESLVAHLRERGQRAINLDLIYGLPGQSLESFGRTVAQIVAIRPSRIALFGYAHVPWMSPHQKELERFAIPDTAERMALFGMAYDRLLDAGYAHVGMDHFALPTDELIIALNQRTLTRNFMGYTTRRGLDLVGIGASSISSVGRTYAQNVKRVSDYLARAGERTWIKGLILNDEDLLRRELILELFCNFHLDIRETERRFGIVFREHFAGELAALQPMIDDALLTVDDAEITVTDLGRFFIRNICMTFDQYLRGEQRVGRYSRTL